METRRQQQRETNRVIREKVIIDKRLVLSSKNQAIQLIIKFIKKRVILKMSGVLIEKVLISTLETEVVPIAVEPNIESITMTGTTLITEDLVDKVAIVAI